MRAENGFTLIELLIIVAIVGVLVAIAIPQFRNYKIRALDARAVASMKRLVEAQENYFVDNEQFATNTSDLTNWADDFNVTTQISASDSDSWAGYSYHSGGSVTYCFNTDNKRGITFVSGPASPCT